VSNQDAEPVVGLIHIRKGFAFLIDFVADGEVYARRCYAKNEIQATELFATNDRFAVTKIRVPLDVWQAEMAAAHKA
jgi:hypothetical protein